MDYPIYIEGRRSGTLSESAEGLYTVFRAECPRRNGMIRLWLHGGGQSACLGLLAPCGEHLVLTRRLSRRARAAFPGTIELVSDLPRFSGRAAPAPPPEPPRQEAESAGWRALGDGTLLAADGRRAIPAALPPGSPLAPHLTRIGGRDYLVFRL